MRAAVVGHLEWVEFVAVERVPRPGEIVHALDWWQEPGGGGAGGAVQLQKLTGDSWFFTALGDDALAGTARTALAKTGLRVHAAERAEASRRAITFVDPGGERTITVLGSRLAPSGADGLPWESLVDVDAVYVTAGDAAAVRTARAARVVVATTRILPLLREAGVYLDAVVGSAVDADETYRRGDLDPAPAPGLVVMTDADRGGVYWERDGAEHRYEPVAPPGPIVDRYGAGDSFAGGLTFALGRGDGAAAAVAFAARCGAAAVSGRGPYAGQLTKDDL